MQMKRRAAAFDTFEEDLLELRELLAGARRGPQVLKSMCPFASVSFCYPNVDPQPQKKRERGKCFETVERAL